MTSCLISYTPVPYCKGVDSKRKQFAPANSFLLGLTPLRKGGKINFDRVVSSECISISLKNFADI